MSNVTARWHIASVVVVGVPLYLHLGLDQSFLSSDLTKADFLQSLGKM